LRSSTPKPATAVKGNGNVAGNIVTGTDNVVGVGNTVIKNPDVNPNQTITTYEFNGWRHRISPGVSDADSGEMDAWKELEAQLKAGNWNELAILSEKEIKTAPEWLTPYYLLGKAYANLCEKEKAKSNLKYFLDKAKGSRAYEILFPNAQDMFNTLQAGTPYAPCN
jgi:hypothetical protein